MQIVINIVTDDKSPYVHLLENHARMENQVEV